MDLMKKLAKIILGIISISPLIIWGLSIKIAGYDIPNTNPLFIINVIVFLSIPAQWIFYITNVFRNNTVAKNQRAIWVLLLFFGSFGAFPFYWYLHIWRDAKKAFKQCISSPDKNPSMKEGSIKFETNWAKIALLIVSTLPVFFALSAIIIRFNETSNALFYILGFSAYSSLMCLILYYVINVSRNNHIAKSQKSLWAMLLIFGNVAIFPFYWYQHVWHRPKSVIDL